MVRPALLIFLILLHAARAEDLAAIPFGKEGGFGALAARLLSPRLAASLLGGVVVAEDHPHSQAGSKVSEITYSIPGGKSSRISLVVRRASSLAESTQVYRAALAVKEGIPMPGFGDEAFLTTEHVLHIRSGWNWLVITADTTHGPDLGMQEEIGYAVLRALHR